MKNINLQTPVAILSNGLGWSRKTTVYVVTLEKENDLLKQQTAIQEKLTELAKREAEDKETPKSVNYLFLKITDLMI
jgi:hypothetical protein